jgi:hypothetical protein
MYPAGVAEPGIAHAWKETFSEKFHVITLDFVPDSMCPQGLMGSKLSFFQTKEIFMKERNARIPSPAL